ncbi:SRPBCC family protein [Amaricoccus sp.]|uniref:SRPBCC family protein n=1 Tax=Amaricoccus sp. TaxID=1872485 RepID=UPI001B4CC739|nr:SRPBCC family protein [Amaricoccus sp.]MBP7000153.1 SRPBCC family protein [Amaricoccus sp.]
MTELAPIEVYGALTAPDTLTIQRLLPAPAEKVWSWLTDSDLRRRWLAAGVMPETPGARFALTWRNDELTDPPGARPDDFGPEHSMDCELIERDPPRRLAYRFGQTGEVSFDLEPRSGGRTLLTLVHRRLPSRSALLNVSSGWHAHLDVMAARLAGIEPDPFWDAWTVLRRDYEQRLPG